MRHVSLLYYLPLSGAPLFPELGEYDLENELPILKYGPKIYETKFKIRGYILYINSPMKAK